MQLNSCTSAKSQKGWSKADVYISSKQLFMQAETIYKRAVWPLLVSHARALVGSNS